MYLRKSRTDDPSLTVAETLSKHEQMLNDYCMRTWGELIPEHNRFREIVSGETIEARPEIKKVLRLIEQDKFKAILIVEPQRLSRGDLEDIGRLSKILRYTRTIVITLQYSYDLTDERDRDYFERELKRGNEYLEYSKRIMQNGLRLCVENGYYMGSQPPYGYRKISVKDGKRTVHTLDIVPDEADAVRMIFQMYADGHGAASICNALNAAGIKPRKADIWRPPVIYVMLDNPHYIGLIRYDSRKMQVTVDGGEIKKRRFRSKSPELYPGKHESIISTDLWGKVQSMRKERHIPPVRSHLDIQNPLAGLVYCECGAVMVKTADTPRRQPRMYCKDQRICGNCSCTIDDLTREITAALHKELADNEIIANDGDGMPESAAHISILQTRLSNLMAKQNALWEKYAEGMPKATFEILIAKNHDEIETCSEMLSEAQIVASRIAQYAYFRTTVHAALDALQDQSSDPKVVNALLKSCIAKITYKRDKPHLENGKKIKPGPEIRIELRF